MSGISRLGDLDTGHGSWPPRPSVTASSSVFIDGIPACRMGDQMDVHCNSLPECHRGTIASGSGSVYSDGLPIARIGDPVSCGGSMAGGSSSTLSG